MHHGYITLTGHGNRTNKMLNNCTTSSCTTSSRRINKVNTIKKKKLVTKIHQ